MPRNRPTPFFAPPYGSAQAAGQQLRERGFALLSGAETQRWSGASGACLNQLAASWNDLPADAYLRDGGRYRFRRHTCFEVGHGNQARLAAHRAHWQPVEYNALHGGIERWFEPMEPHTLHNAALLHLIHAMGTLCGEVFAAPPGNAPWCVEAHQFRIDTANGIGRPTPEGAHRDGVDLVAVFLVARQGIKGGETRIFEAASPSGQRFTLTEPWSVLLLDDARMVHETTPIQPQAPATEDSFARMRQAPLDAGVDVKKPSLIGYRDTLVVTWRRGSFQGPAALGAGAA